MAWPIVHQTQHAILVDILGSRVWLRKQSFVFKGFSANYLQPLYAELNSASIEKVRVWRAGKGPSEKSHKYRVEVERRYEDEYGRVHKELVTRTFVLAEQLIVHEENKSYAPYGIVKKKLAHNEFLPDGWPGLQEVKRQIAEISQRIKLADEVTEKRYAESMKKQKADETEREQQHQRERKERIALLRRNVTERAEPALEFCRERFTLPEIQKHIFDFRWPTMPLDLDDLKTLEMLSKLIDLAEKGKKTKPKQPDKVLADVTVEWVDWVGSARNRKKVEQSCDDCTVKFFGKKRTIIFPDGDSINKMEGPNLKIYETQIHA